MRKIFVIGANSYLGFEFYSFFSGLSKNSEIELFPVARENIFNSKNYISSYDFFNIKKTFENCEVYYFISLDRQNSKVDKFTIDINIDLFTQCYSKFRNSKFHYFSTFSVYQDSWNFINLSEKSEINFESIYGQTHYICEKFGLSLGNSFENKFYAYRLTNSFGFCSRIGGHKYVINDFLIQAFNENKIVIKSDGSFIRDFVFVEDVINALSNVNKSNLNSEIFNLSSGESYMAIQIAEIIKKCIKNIKGNSINIYKNLSEKVISVNNSKENFPIVNSKLIEYGFFEKTDIVNAISKSIIFQNKIAG